MGARRQEEPLWDLKQIAEHLNVTERWVRREGPTYGLPLLRIGGLIRAKPTDIYAWVDQQREYE